MSVAHQKKIADEIFQIFSYFLKVELFLNHVLYRTIYVTRNNQIILGGMNFSKQCSAAIITISKIGHH
jgi:hypothetical protein